MARYWDYPSNMSSYWPTYGASGSTTSPTWAYQPYMRNSTYVPTCGTSTGTNTYYVSVPIVQTFLVKSPEHWSKEDIADFVYLINDATKTGFKVTMVINSDDIEITDPTVQKRDMADFVPLLLSCANTEDQGAIRAFFVVHTIDAPEEPK